MPLPTIVAPVSRLLAVRDTGRSVAFYRDVLGFEVRGVREEGDVPVWAELVNGPARIEIALGEITRDSTLAPRPRGSAIILFATDDVEAMRAAVVARGGEATELEKVNWIKLRLFQIRDPDGHTLWFGQSFHEPDSPRPRPMLRKALPALPFDDIAAGVAHYRDVLGFHIDYQQHDLGVMDRDEVTVLLIPRTDRIRGVGAATVYIEDADRLFAELQRRGARVQAPPISRPWGLRDFTVLDPEGNELTFAEPFE